MHIHHKIMLSLALFSLFLAGVALSLKIYTPKVLKTPTRLVTPTPPNSIDTLNLSASVVSDKLTFSLRPDIPLILAAFDLRLVLTYPAANPLPSMELKEAGWAFPIAKIEQEGTATVLYLSGIHLSPNPFTIQTITPLVEITLTEPSQVSDFDFSIDTTATKFLTRTPGETLNLIKN